MNIEEELKKSGDQLILINELNISLEDFQHV
jgi:hypothetical protein